MVEEEKLDRSKGHEGSEIPLGRIIAALAGLVAAIAVVMVIVTFIYYEMVLNRPLSGTAAAPVVDTTQAPPAPRLQDRPPQDLKQMRDYEESVLTSYGWVDKQAGTVRIPIDRAMDLLAQKGLPAEIAPLPAGQTANPSPPETSAGRSPQPANAPAMPPPGRPK